MAWIKWKLLLTTLPLVALAIGLRVVLEQVLGFQGGPHFADIAVVVTGGVFLIGFMLAGVMADYKESEKLPGEVACILESLEEILGTAASLKPELDGLRLKKDLGRITQAILDRLHRRIEANQLYEEVSLMENAIHAIGKSGAPMILAGRIITETHNLRRMLTRMDVISRTNFLASGYALLETLLVVVVGLAVIAKYKSPFATYTVVSFVSLVFVYMLRLIKDIDDPFEYSPDGTVSGSAEVELFPIKEFQARLQSRIVAHEVARAEARPAIGTEEDDE